MLQIYRPKAPICWDWLGIHGPDAGDFLHRLTTVHVRALKPGEGAPGFFLTAQGKIRAYFHLWKVSADRFEEEFFLEFEAGESGKWKKELLELIEQFHFGEKFNLDTAPAQRPDLACAWIFGDTIWAGAGHWAEVEPGIRAFHHGTVDYGTAWVTVWGSRQDLDVWVGKLGARLIEFDQLERMRISMARPRIDHELSNETIPLDAGLKEAISADKGCYPGQEVIEKIISLGSPARRLVRIDGDGTAPAPGQSIFDLSEKSSEIGKVTSAASTDGGFQALGFVRKTHAREGTEVSFQTASASSGRIALIPEYKP